MFLLLAPGAMGCGAVPDSRATEACYSVFDAWSAAGAACGYEATMPDREVVCRDAYSYSDEELNGNCLPWLRSGACAEYTNAGFKAHCGKSLFLKTW